MMTRRGDVGSLAANLTDPTRVVAQALGGAGRHESRHGNRHTIIETFERRDFLRVLLDGVGELPHQVAATGRVHGRPRTTVKGPARGFYREVDILSSTGGGLREHFASGGIDDVEHLARQGGNELAVNEKAVGPGQKAAHQGERLGPG